MQEPEINLGVLLFIPYRNLENRILRAVRDAGFDDVTLAQARIFQRIAPGGLRLTDLANQAQMTKQSAAGLVEQLERAGYVRRVPDPVDQRARLIQIDERGRQAAALAQAVHDQVVAEWRDHLGPRRAADLTETLGRLRQITDPDGPRPD